VRDAPAVALSTAAAPSQAPTVRLAAYETPAQPDASPTLLQAEPVSALSRSQVKAVSGQRGRGAGVAVVVLLVVGIGGLLAFRRNEPKLMPPAPKLVIPPVVLDAGALAAVVPSPAPTAAVVEPDAGSSDPIDAGSMVAAGVVKPDAKTGRVDLVVLPWAEVRHNGALLGVTPLDELRLPKGTQTLELTNPELGVTKKVQVRVPAGGVTTLKVDLMAE
jgi:hypothetical protein